MSDPQLLYDRGFALWREGRLEDALASTEAALALKPDYFEALYNRGVMLRHLGRMEEALVSFDEALRLNARLPEIHNNRGVVLQALERNEEALGAFECALILAPGSVGAHNNRGGVLYRLKRYDEALAGYERAVRLDPNHADAYFNRGTALDALRRPEEAIASFRRALALEPGHADALTGLAVAALYSCDWDTTESLAETIKARTAQGETILQPLNFMAFCDDPLLQRRCAENQTRAWVPKPLKPLWDGAPYGHDKIRVAYLSSDFNTHATALLMAQLFERHDRARFEIIALCFSEDDNSEMRARLIKAFDQFHIVRKLSDFEAARKLRALEVDIAVDLKGHTGGARPAILGHRPAPVQVNYLGFPSTMGADFIDYVLADRVVLPFDRQPYYAEKIVHLPGSYQVNDSARRIAPAPSRAEAGLPEQGFVFCSFNNHWKITRPIFAIWMRLLHRVPGSVLWLIGNNEGARRRLCLEAQAQGIDAARLVFSEKTGPELHLGRHQLADLFLDTIPVNAHTTASDALWAGVPVVTCMGNGFAARVAGSLLHAVGLPELATENLDDYEALAFKLASDAPFLKSIREKLAANRLASALFDTDRSRRHIEAAYRIMWEIAERGEKPRSFTVAPL